MRKIIKLNESQLFNLIDEKAALIEQEYPRYVEHWENKFEKSALILIKAGHSPNDLIEKIKIIANKNQI
jgi:hypothetical protein